MLSILSSIGLSKPDISFVKEKSPSFKLLTDLDTSNTLENSLSATNTVILINNDSMVIIVLPLFLFKFSQARCLSKFLLFFSFNFSFDFGSTASHSNFGRDM